MSCATYCAEGMSLFECVGLWWTLGSCFLAMAYIFIAIAVDWLKTVLREGDGQHG